MTVPFVDLARQTEGLEHAFRAVLSDHLRLSEFAGGQAIHDFEAAWAELCGRSYAVGTSSGLDALRLALLAAGVGPGTTVFVPAMTFLATWEAVTQTGANVRPVDVDIDTYNIDVGKLAFASEGGDGEAVVPVALYGVPSLADDIFERTSLTVVEDACQAHGAARLSKSTAATCFSFYPTKNLGALGDAGAVVTDHPRIAQGVRALRSHGEEGGEHKAVGYTARLDAIQAAFLLLKLPRLAEWNHRRAVAAAQYVALLEGLGDLVMPPTGGVHHLFVVRTGSRDRLRSHLALRGIGSKSHYPVPPHLTAAYSHLGYGEGSFPNAELLASTGLSLPLFPGITVQEVAEVCSTIRRFFA